MGTCQISFRIKHFIIGFSFILLLFISIFLFFIPHRLYTNEFVSQAEYYCNNFLAQANTGVETALTQFNSKVQEIINDQSIQKILHNTKPESSSQYDYQIIISEYFDPKTMDAYYLQEFDLYIKNSGEYLQYGTKPTQLTEPFSSNYYSQALANPTRVNWLSYNSDLECIEIATIAYDKNNYEVLGLIIIRLSTDFLMYKFDAYNTLDIDELYIADQHQQVLCSTETSALGCSLEEIHLNTVPGTTETKDSIIIMRSLCQGNSRFPYDSWSSIIVLKRQELLKSFQQIAFLFYILAIIILIASLFVFIKFSNFITTPISELVSAMKGVEKEQLNISLPEAYSLTEIAEINHGFNQMVSRLNILINNVYKIKLAEQESQLKILQSQINPHFLFNTLQLISWKAYDYDAMPVCDMIASLSYMLQTDLCSDNDNTFTLREEIEYIRQYEKIIQCKYNDKIKIIIDVPDELIECKIPKLILQPFLENSITHGLAPKAVPGTVSLSVRKESNDIVVTIQDDGVGMRSNILNQIQNSNIKTDPHANNIGHHIALKNIQDRISLLYGESYGFTLQSQINKGTQITVKLPYIT